MKLTYVIQPNSFKITTLYDILNEIKLRGYYFGDKVFVYTKLFSNRPDIDRYIFNILVIQTFTSTHYPTFTTISEGTSSPEGKKKLLK